MQNAKKLLIIGYFVVGFLLLAGVVYVVLMMTGVVSSPSDNDGSKSETRSLVAPSKVISSLKAVSDSNKDAYDAHQEAKQTFLEKPVRLVK